MSRKCSKFYTSTTKLFLIMIGFFSHNTYANLYNTETAKIFASIYSDGKATSSQLDNIYLNQKSEGLNIFKGRIRNAKHLADTVSENQRLYEKAISLCLPVANQISQEVETTVDMVSSYLNMSNDVSVDIIFGANNTGGTASPKGIAIALEVICQQVETTEEAKLVILSYVAHEVVHVYQYRQNKRSDFNFTLLELSLIEGVADLVASEILGDNYMLDIEREKYGTQNEVLLWQEFKPYMHGMNYAPWMYSKPIGERPIDMGYWVGKSIAKAYSEQYSKKQIAFHKLLVLEDSKAILKYSRYNPRN